MFISLNFFVRKQGLSWEEFSHHWSEVHAPLLTGTPGIARHMRRYVQHHLRPNATQPNCQPLAFDGFAETWFDSEDDRRRMLAEPEFARLVTPDTHRFIELSVVRTAMSDTQLVKLGTDLSAS